MDVSRERRLSKSNDPVRDKVGDFKFSSYDDKGQFQSEADVDDVVSVEFDLVRLDVSH